MEHIVSLLLEAGHVVLASDHIEPEGFDERLVEVIGEGSLRGAVEKLFAALHVVCRKEFEEQYDDPVLRGKIYALGLFACGTRYVVYSAETEPEHFDYEFFAVDSRREAEEKLRYLAQQIIEALRHSLEEAPRYGASEREIEELKNMIAHIEREYLA